VTPRSIDGKKRVGVVGGIVGATAGGLGGYLTAKLSNGGLVGKVTGTVGKGQEFEHMILYMHSCIIPC
jgi:hypothetical protein